MSRFFIAIAALLMSALTITPAVLAADSVPTRFEIEARRNAPDRVHLALRDDARHAFMTGSDFAYRELGLSPAKLRGDQRLRFALVREPGRMDCAGKAQRGRGTGTCRFISNPAFNALLLRFGIKTPSERQGLGLMFVGASGSLVEALGRARYPVPTIDQLTALAALDVTPAYISELSRRGYRPDRLDDLTAFKALDVSPAYVDGMTRAGFGRIPASQIIQLKALGVSPDYVAGLRRAGYRTLRPDEVVQMKAMGITPEYVAGLRSRGIQLPVSKLIQYKALGLSPRAIAESRAASR